MLNAISVILRGASSEGAERAARAMERQGFFNGPRYEWACGELRTWEHPSQRRVANCEIRTASEAAFCVGPIWYRSRFGTAALHLLLHDVETGRIDEVQLRGNFALFLRTRTHCLLMNDPLGFVRLYASSDDLFYSSSWLATCTYGNRTQLDEGVAAEYVLLGAAHSDKTVADTVTALPFAYAFDLVRKRRRLRFSAEVWQEDTVPASFEAAADRICEHLREVHTEVTLAFPAQVRAALSGGFDSRLIAAGLLATANRPELFVYGDTDSEDVRIARAVVKNTNLELDIIDKAALNRHAPRPDLERLAQSALFFDGLPNDGIYDPGADQATRLEQTAGGRLVLNGGGGEILRNFFHLPDSRLSAMDIVRAFYRGFDPGVFRRRDALTAWSDNLAVSIESAVGVVSSLGNSMLTRPQVELIYPLFRCHYWMSVNNSIGVRHGYYSTPLVDLNAVRLTFALPIAWKNAGRLESRIITKLHPGLASQPSSYGFRFSDGPNRRAHINEWATCMRPVFMRPFINAARRHLHRQGVSHDLIAHCRSLLPGEWRLDSLLDLQRLPDNTAFARALAIEVAWRELIS